MKIKFYFLLAIFLIIGCKAESGDQSSSDNKSVMIDSSARIDIESTHDIEEPQKSIFQTKLELQNKGYEVMEMVDASTNDTILMQKYFMAFLKNGPVRDQNEEEAKKLQGEHMAHLSKMYELGYADISGPFEDDGDIRGITVYNVPTLQMADSLANADPMVKAKRLQIEIHPWWAMKTSSLR